MNLGELYLALQQGTVDAQENPLAGTINRSFHEVQKYFSLSNHVYTPVTLVMNKAKYDSLSDEHKDLVKSAALEAAQYTRDLGAKFDDELLEKLKSEGKNEVNEIDLAAFQAASDPIYAAVSELAGEDLVNRMRSAASN